jgi:hypothetical protein
MCRWPSRIPLPQTRTDLCAHSKPRPEPAPATCKLPSREPHRGWSAVLRAASRVGRLTRKVLAEPAVPIHLSQSTLHELPQRYGGAHYPTFFGSEAGQDGEHHPSHRAAGIDPVGQCLLDRSRNAPRWPRRRTVALRIHRCSCSSPTQSHFELFDETDQWNLQRPREIPHFDARLFHICSRNRGARALDES